MNDEMFENYLSPEIKAELQEFYGLAPDEVTDAFLDELLTLRQAEADLRKGLMYPSLAQAAREEKDGAKRLKTIAIGGGGERVGIYQTTRRWLWQAIDSGLVQPRWKE